MTEFLHLLPFFALHDNKQEDLGYCLPKFWRFWYSITFLIYDSAEPKVLRRRQKLFGKLIKATLMGRFLWLLHPYVHIARKISWLEDALHFIYYPFTVSIFFGRPQFETFLSGHKNNLDSCMKLCRDEEASDVWCKLLWYLVTCDNFKLKGLSSNCVAICSCQLLQGRG